jgi:outer membrane protein
MRHWMGCLFIGIFSATAHADDLLSIYQMALSHNTKFQIEMAKQGIDQAQAREAKSAFYPHVNMIGDAGYLDSSTHFDAESSYFPTLPVRLGGQGQLYNASIKVEQILFDFAAIKRLSAAKKMAAAETIMQQSYQQDLMYRVAADYFSVLSESQELKYLTSERTFYAQQLKVAKDKKELHRGTEVDIDEAMTSSRLSEAAIISSKNKLSQAMRRLSEDTGSPLTVIKGLEKNIPVQEPTPFHVSQWKALALENNVILRATRLKLQAAKDNVAMKKSSGLPVGFVEAGASHTHLVDPVFQNMGVSSMEGMVGVKVPLLDGGFTKASTLHAAREYERDNLKYQEAVIDVNAAVTDVFEDIVTLNQKLKSDRTALQTAKMSKKSAANAYSVGMGDMSNMLVGEKMFFRARTALERDQYDYLLLELKLEQLVGSLNFDYLVKINGYLTKRTMVSVVH